MPIGNAKPRYCIGLFLHHNYSFVKVIIAMLWAIMYLLGN